MRLAVTGNQLRVGLHTTRARFEYLSYTVLGSRLAIDLWKSSPPSSAAELPTGTNGCLTLAAVHVSKGLVASSGREHNLFEHQFQVVLRGRDGSVLSRALVVADSGHWHNQLHYRTSTAQPGTLEGAAASPKDGALTCLVQARVTLPASS